MALGDFIVAEGDGTDIKHRQDLTAFEEVQEISSEVCRPFIGKPRSKLSECVLLSVDVRFCSALGDVPLGSSR